MRPKRRSRFSVGLLATAFTTWLLTSVLLYFGSYLTGQYQAWGFLCFVALLGAMFRRSLGNAKISCGDRRSMELVTRRLARYLRVEFWSW